MYEFEDELEDSVEEFDDSEYDDEMDELGEMEEEETLEELDVDDRGHVRPRRHRRDEEDDYGAESYYD